MRARTESRWSSASIGNQPAEARETISETFSSSLPPRVPEVWDQQRHSASDAPVTDKIGTASSFESPRNRNPMDAPAADPSKLLPKRVANEHSVSNPGAAAPNPAPIAPPTSAPWTN